MIEGLYHVTILKHCLWCRIYSQNQDPSVWECSHLQWGNLCLQLS